jgi:hypothetical protein
VGPGLKVFGLAISPNGRYVVAAKSRALPRRGDGKDARDAHLLAWDANSGRLIAATNYGQGFVGPVAFSPDGQRLAYQAPGSIRIVELDPRLFP